MTIRLTPSAYSAGSAPYWTGVGLALLLAAALLAITLSQTLTTFFIRMYDLDVMLRAVGNVSFYSRVTLDVALFGLGVLIVHLILALAVHALAFLTERAWPAANGSRRGLVVFWFGLAVTAILLLNAEWFPRSNAGSYYAGFATRSLGPFSVAWGVTLLAVCVAATVLTVALWRMLPDAIVRWRCAPAFCAEARSRSAR